MRAHVLILAALLVPLTSAQQPKAAAAPDVRKLLEKLGEIIEDKCTFTSTELGTGEHRMNTRITTINKELVAWQWKSDTDRTEGINARFTHTVHWANLESISISKSIESTELILDFQVRKPNEVTIMTITSKTNSIPPSTTIEKGKGGFLNFAKRADANLFRDQLFTLMKKLGLKIKEVDPDPDK